MNESSAALESMTSSGELERIDYLLRKARTHYLAPRNNNEFLIQPAARSAELEIEQNRQQYNVLEQDFWGKPLRQWRSEARKQVLTQAQLYTRNLLSAASLSTVSLSPTDGQFADEPQLDENAPLIATGHQPELFHIGVWAKNLLASEYGKRLHGNSLNLIVDSDTVKSRSISVPALVNGQLTVRRLPVDEWRIGIPWQEQTVRNQALFSSFPDRVTKEMPPLESASLLNEYWQIVQKKTQAEQGSVVDGLVSGRIWLERKLGISNWEIPLSQLCELPVFQQFMAALIKDAQAFRKTYNDSLAWYRKIYRLKNNSHPIPDLQKSDNEIELPFWIWSQNSPRRRGLYLRCGEKQLQLTDLAGFDWVIPESCRSCLESPETLAFHLGELIKTGVRIRPRALITTLFMRLFVTDWFIHGIGGAKYDEVTDLIIRQHWQIAPPRFQVATGTLWIPLKNLPASSTANSAELRQKLRYAQENPESLELPASCSQQNPLIEKKRALIEKQKQYREQNQQISQQERISRKPIGQELNREFSSLRNALREQTQPQLQQLEADLYNAVQTEQTWKTAKYREYPVCLYPLEHLTQLTQTIASKLQE